MFSIIVLVILSLITAGLALVWFAGRNREYDDGLPGFVPVIAGIVTFLTLIFMSITTVDARAVGIQTSFGRYAGTLQPGIQLIAPWSSVEEFTTRLQPADLEGKEGVAVTFLGGGSGTVDATFRWQISDAQGEGGAKALWEKYRDFDSVTNTLVLREARDAVLNVSNDYTPNEARTKQDVIGAEIARRLTERLARYGVLIDSVSVLGMRLDERTQASLDKIVAAQNDVERAKADNQRAKIDGETAQLRESTGSLSPEALTRYCLEVVNSWDVNRNGPLPATFNCGLGNGQPVIVGGAR